ncbi:MAG: hypothetical protein ACYTGQ_14200, partial [Planctomycetota bacterium]
MLNNHGLLNGNGQITNELLNLPDGTIRATAGQQVRFTGIYNANLGDINLLGGVVEFTHNLVNTSSGRVNGRGILRADGGLENLGQMNFSGG